MTREYKPPRGALKFVVHARNRPTAALRGQAAVTKDEAERAGRPKFFHVRAGILNTTPCPCDLSYPIIEASLPKAWIALSRKAKKRDGDSTYYTCNCQGSVQQ